MTDFNISSQNINPSAREACQILQNHNYQAFMVGGCVRDLLLNQIPHDFDIATNATPEQIMQIFPHNYPTGIKHGTITVLLNDQTFEITTFRNDGTYSNNRHPDNISFVSTIEEDLNRRDLTINAMAYDPISNTIIDPHNGYQDLQKRILKTVGDPNARFQEDALRMMRVGRFAARFNYNIDINTFVAIKSNATLLSHISRERIRDELCKILLSNYSSYGLDILKETGILSISNPVLMSKPIYYKFLFDQDMCKGELETRIAFLYSNCNDDVGISRELVNLKFSGKEIRKINFLIHLLDAYHEFDTKKLSYSNFISILKNQNIDSYDNLLNQFIILLDAIGINSAPLKEQKITVYSRKEMQINGDDLISLGINPGKQIKEILDKCYDDILQNPEHNNKEYLINMANNLKS